MVNSSDKERIRSLLLEAITALCRNGLEFNFEFSIEGLLGITVDKEDIFLVNIKETVVKAADPGKYGAHLKEGQDHSYQTISFTSTLEGVTGEFVQVPSAANGDSGCSTKIKKSRGKKRHHPKVEPGVTTSSASMLPSDLVVGSSSWDPGLDVSPASVVTAMGQLSGIAQPTQEWFMRESMRLSAQLDNQRRRSRDHMRKYRQQLRSGNLNEYEDRKKRQREGMRRYRERLRMENPDKYAEMNRKHAEQERKRRLRIRSFSASFGHQAAVNQSTIQPTSDHSTPSTVLGTKLGTTTTDFLHMAMENSQLLPVNQLIQTSFPLASTPVGLTPGAISMASPGMAVSLPTGSVALSAVHHGTDGTPGNLSQVTLENVHTDPPTQQHSHHQHQHQVEIPVTSQAARHIITSVGTVHTASSDEAGTPGVVQSHVHPEQASTPTLPASQTIHIQPTTLHDPNTQTVVSSAPVSGPVNVSADHLVNSQAHSTINTESLQSTSQHLVQHSSNNSTISAIVVTPTVAGT